MLIVITQEKGKDPPSIFTFHTGASLRRFLYLRKLKPEDFCIIEGELLKAFNQTCTEKGKALCHV